MISFWTNRESSWSLLAYCGHRGRAIAGHFECRVYEDLGSTVRLRPGAHIFAAIDRLTPNQREAAALMHDALAARMPGAPKLNDPRRVLMRFELLTKLHEAGVNAYRAFRARDAHRVSRFPVFLREADNHTGPLTGLLQSKREVSRALWGLRARGWPPGDLLVVEFCDTSDAHGVFRKYSAFAVGDRIVPCHVMATHQWSVKSNSSERDESLIRENLAYIDGNPHERWLRELFSIAGAEYGRIDYAMLNGAPQVWEINLSPTISMAANRKRKSLAPALETLREQEREAFHSRLRDAFLALDRNGAGPDVEVAFTPALAAGLARDAAKQQRREQLRTWLHRVYEAPGVGRPFRALYRRVRPRL